MLAPTASEPAAARVGEAPSVGICAPPWLLAAVVVRRVAFVGLAALAALVLAWRRATHDEITTARSTTSATAMGITIQNVISDR